MQEYSYKEDWDMIYDSFSDDDLLWIGVDIDEESISAVQNISGKDIIDLGCGDGSFCELLSLLDNRVVGIDISKKQINKCRERNTSVHYEVADVLSLNCKEQYDVVVCRLLLHHIHMKDVEKLVNVINSLCKKYGKLILSFLIPPDNITGMRESYYSVKHQVILYSINDVRTMFNQFKVTDIFQCTASKVAHKYNYVVLIAEKE